MRYLGIDYGTKNVGLAVSDEENTMGLPLSVLPNDKDLIMHIQDICEEKGITEIVLGESLNFKMEDNELMREARPFKEDLERVLGISVYWEPEWLTSQEAAHIQGAHSSLDASAASLILQAYLDKLKNKA